MNIKLAFFNTILIILFAMSGCGKGGNKPQTMSTTLPNSSNSPISSASQCDLVDANFMDAVRITSGSYPSELSVPGRTSSYHEVVGYDEEENEYVCEENKLEKKVNGKRVWLKEISGEIDNSPNIWINKGEIYLLLNNHIIVFNKNGKIVKDYVLKEFYDINSMGYTNNGSLIVAGHDGSGWPCVFKYNGELDIVWQYGDLDEAIRERYILQTMQNDDCIICSVNGGLRGSERAEWIDAEGKSLLSWDPDKYSYIPTNDGGLILLKTKDINGLSTMRRWDKSGNLIWTKFIEVESNDSVGRTYVLSNDLNFDNILFWSDGIEEFHFSKKTYNFDGEVVSDFECSGRCEILSEVKESYLNDEFADVFKLNDGNYIIQKMITYGEETNTKHYYVFYKVDIKNKKIESSADINKLLDLTKYKSVKDFSSINIEYK